MTSKSSPGVPDYRNICRRVAETAANWADCSDHREMATVFRELGCDCQTLIEQETSAERRAFVLYDYDLRELVSRRVNWDQADAESAADRLHNVIVIALPIVSDSPDAEDLAPCECELPGQFFSGVPGILACIVDGRVAPSVKIERCDACQRFQSDEAARNRLIALGIAPCH